jgi:hypothetical protein
LRGCTIGGYSRRAQLLEEASIYVNFNNVIAFDSLKLVKMFNVHCAGLLDA